MNESPDPLREVLSGSHSTTVRSVMLRLLLTIMLAELAIMLLFTATGLDMHPLAEALLDAFLLSMLSAPVIYLWIVRPFVRARDLAEDRVRHLALHDPLTELPNRRLLEAFAQRTLAMERRNRHGSAVLLIDLDGFKPINDRHGHEAGDAVLRAVAERIRSALRASDLSARIGGDEFAVVLDGLGGSGSEACESALRVADKIRERIVEAIPFGPLALHIDCSIGVRVVDGASGDIEVLLREADTALYEAKRGGGAQVRLFTADTQQPGVTR
jgi:diguanylate cyclase (GGDEF)-like protein